MRFVELFAGIGGFRMGLEAHAHKCVFASEIDKHARETYHANFGETPHGDITKIKSEDIPDHDILTGGFPCQSFSIAGKRGGFDDVRGTLFFEIARIAKDKKPTWLFLENVPGLLSHDDGKTFQVIVSTLSGLGYGLDWKVLNTKDFGPPQSRRRIFIIGKLGANLFWKFDWPKPNPSGLVLRDILENNPDDKYFLSRKLSRELIDWKSTRKPEVGQAHRVYGGDENGPALNQGCHGLVHIATIGKDGQANRVYYPDGTSTTLSSQGGGRGAKTGLYQIRGRIRRLTPRECARLQGFPETFKIRVSDSQAYKQFGNAVSVPVITAIGEGF